MTTTTTTLTTITTATTTEKGCEKCVKILVDSDCLLDMKNNEGCFCC